MRLAVPQALCPGAPWIGETGMQGGGGRAEQRAAPRGAERDTGHPHALCLINSR